MMGVAEPFQPADEGWGPRKVPVVEDIPARLASGREPDRRVRHGGHRRFRRRPWPDGAAVNRL